MIKYQDLLEKSKAFSLICGDIQENMLSHAYMIVSPDNGALEEFLKLFLIAEYVPNRDEEAITSKKILNRNHADVIHIEKEKSITVDDIKEIVDESFVSSVEGGRKTFVIHQADKMTAQAQNKLLKILEEPPQNVVFILSVNNINSMLTTIKSRVKKIQLDFFKDKDIYNELLHFTDDIEKAKVASICAEGEISKAVDLLTNDGYLGLYNDVIKLLKELNHSSEIIKYINLDMFSKANISDTLDILMIILRDVAVVKKDKDVVLSKHILGDILDLSNKFSTASCIGIIEKIEKFKKMLYYNINNLNVAEQLLFAILEVRFRCN